MTLGDNYFHSRARVHLRANLNGNFSLARGFSSIYAVVGRDGWYEKSSRTSSTIESLISESDVCVCSIVFVEEVADGVSGDGFLRD